MNNLNDDKKAKCFSSEHLSFKDNGGFDSDVNDYDSDCSLGSVNSLYLSLKDNSKRKRFDGPNEMIKNQFSDEFSDLIKINRTPLRNNNLSTGIEHTEKIMISDNIKDKNKKKEIDIFTFYGKQESIKQCHYSSLLDLRKLKRKCQNSKTLKHKYSVNKLKKNKKKSCTSLKNPKLRTHLFTQRMLTTKKIFLEDKKLIRNQLKENIPLIQFNHKAFKQVEQNSNKYTLLNTDGNWFLKKIKFIRSFENIGKKDFLQRNYVENQLSETTTGLMIDFVDLDDFGCTQIVDGVISMLYCEDYIQKNKIFSEL